MHRMIISLILMTSPAFAGKDTLNVKTRARIVDPIVYGMTMEEWQDVTVTGSPAWKTKQCCMVEAYNRTHERQVSHDYCSDAQIVEWMSNGICGILT